MEVYIGRFDMRIEKIDENKIKVLMDTDEAREWNVSSSNMASNTPEIREMFMTALKLAERDAEFCIDGARLFVEAIPGHTDGFGMLITKIFSDSDLEEAVSKCPYQGTVRKRQLTFGAGGGKISGKRIFRFREFDDVCRAADAIHNFFEGESTLYKHAGVYYMLLIPENSSMMLRTEKIMLEFSDKQSRTLISHGRLNELADVMIRRNAVDVLIKYFL